MIQGTSTPDENARLTTTSEELARYDPIRDTWDDLTQDADSIFGNDLAADELLDSLTGVPFLIHHLTFRPGILRRDKTQGAYVSCEAVTAPELNLAKINIRRRAAKMTSLETLESLPFGPGSHVVFNDGSTGIYRQIVQYLAAKQYITLKSPIVEQGESGESSYDAIPADWEGIHKGDLRFDPQGFGNYSADIRLHCPRGIRLSEYQNDWTNGETKVTRYLA